MRLLAILWTAGWVIAGIYMASKEGRSKTRAAVEALLLGPFVLLLLNFARQAKKSDVVTSLPQSQGPKV